MMQDNRRQSMPPTFPPQPPQQDQMHQDSSHDQLQPPPQRQPMASPQPQQRQHPGPGPSPQPPQHHDFASPPIPQPRPLPAHAKHNSIFTPIDDSRSLLAQHWGTSGMMEHPRTEPIIKLEDGAPRPASIDVAAMNRDRKNGLSPQPPPARAPHQSPQPPQRTASTSSVPIIAPPARASTAPDAKRPRLKVQIPSEASGDEAATADSDAASTSQLHIVTGPQQQQGSHSHVVLPPPSPSTNTLLSAGAQGPPNPFARPAPPMSTNPHAANRENIETPMTALPSRFMQEMLPSPSTFYSEWGFGRSNDGMLPSPMNFQTPVVSNGQGWREEDRKRAAEEEAAGTDAKRSKG
jgi:MADS-box transcription factor